MLNSHCYGTWHVCGVLYVKGYGISSVECHVDACEGWMSYAIVNKAVSLVTVNGLDKKASCTQVYVF